MQDSNLPPADATFRRRVRPRLTAPDVVDAPNFPKTCSITSGQSWTEARPSTARRAPTCFTRLTSPTSARRNLGFQLVGDDPAAVDLAQERVWRRHPGPLRADEYELWRDADIAGRAARATDPVTAAERHLPSALNVAGTDGLGCLGAVDRVRLSQS